MDSWEITKIAGGVLSALLVAFGSGTIAEILAGGSGARPPSRAMCCRSR